MKKSYYLLLLVLLATVSAKAQTGWITKKLDQKLSVKFPAEPKIVTKNGIDSFVATTADSIKYASTLIDFQTVVHWDSAMVAQRKDSQLFAEAVRNGMVQNKPNYTFGNISISKWKTYTMYTTSATDKTTKGTLTTRMLIIGTKMYSLSCLVPVNVVTKNQEAFFDSAEVL